MTYFHLKFVFQDEDGAWCWLRPHQEALCCLISTGLLLFLNRKTEWNQHKISDHKFSAALLQPADIPGLTHLQRAVGGGCHWLEGHHLHLLLTGMRCRRFGCG
jgi:hypothetical protein